MNLFEAVRDNVTTRQAAELYGISVNRKGMAVCPFHDDKNPSMKVDNRFHCFGCQADGDAIEFVARLFDLSRKEAAKKLANDFGISYDSRDRASIKPFLRRPTPEQKYREEEQHFFNVTVDYYHRLQTWEKEFAPETPVDAMHPLFLEALQNKNFIDNLLDNFLNSAPEERKALVSSEKNLVMNIERRVANLSFASELLPLESHNTDLVRSYLEGRGIDRDIINWCIETKCLYESYPHHNVVFVGQDKDGTARSATQRGCGNNDVNDVNEVEGGDKCFSFGTPSQNNSGTLCVFETAIDLLSFATLVKMNGYNWHSVNMLSFECVCDTKKNIRNARTMLPVLEQYLTDHSNISKVITFSNGDEVGRVVSAELCEHLSSHGMEVKMKIPPKGEDYNDYLCILKGLPITHRQPHDKKAAKEEAAPAADSVPDRKTTEAVR